MFSIIMGLIGVAWDYIKKIWLAIVNFAKNIISWFRNRDRLEKIKKNEAVIAVSIKEKLNNGDYNVVNCLFDQDENKLVDTEVIQTGSLDAETQSNFGNKQMIVLQ